MFFMWWHFGCMCICLIYVLSYYICPYIWTSTCRVAWRYGTVKMGWLKSISGISYLTATTQPLGIQNIWHCALTHYITKTLNFKSPLFLVFLSLQTLEVTISELGLLGPILGSKQIPLVRFFYRCNSRTNKLLEHQKLDKIICAKKDSYQS